jgi:hypothetical protein
VKGYNAKSCVKVVEERKGKVIGNSVKRGKRKSNVNAVCMNVKLSDVQCSQV